MSLCMVVRISSRKYMCMCGYIHGHAHECVRMSCIYAYVCVNVCACKYVYIT